VAVEMQPDEALDLAQQLVQAARGVLSHRRQQAAAELATRQVLLLCGYCRKEVAVAPVQHGNQLRADCPQCGRFIKWVGKKEAGL
jgi:hypothetical protein